MAGNMGTQKVVITGSNVKDYWTTSGPKSFTSNRYSLVVSNDGAADLTVTINGMTLTVKTGESIDEKFDAFTTLTITATTAFRAWARG